MDLNVLLAGLGINACVALATAVTGLVRGNRISLTLNFNGVKVDIDGNSNREQPKTNKVSDNSCKFNNFEINVDQRYCPKHESGVQIYFICKNLMINR